jgi:UDP-3-O-[3-hydroxymyristoyl] glucosamine N-acyltransferase
MADPRFFTRAGPFALAHLAEVAGARLADPGTAEHRFSDVAPLDTAGADDVSFLENRRYLTAFAASSAGACIVHPDLADRAPAGMALLLHETPYAGYARIARAFYPEPPVVAGIDPTARLAPSARLDEGVRIEVGAVIGDGVEIGPRTTIGCNCVIGAGVRIGADCRIADNVTLSHCLVGDRVLIHPGASIGQRGFGWALLPTGHVQVPQLGRVLIEDDVEIGANCTIDRGAGPDTVIGAGSKIDNLVQIGHNVRLGRGCIIVSQAGVSGSTTLEDFVVIAAQAGLAGHLTVGKGAKIAAQSGVMRDVEAGAEVCGAPAVPVKQFFRQVATVQRLANKKGG